MPRAAQAARSEAWSRVGTVAGLVAHTASTNAGVSSSAIHSAAHRAWVGPLAASRAAATRAWVSARMPVSPTTRSSARMAASTSAGWSLATYGPTIDQMIT